MIRYQSTQIGFKYAEYHTIGRQQGHVVYRIMWTQWRDIRKAVGDITSMQNTIAMSMYTSSYIRLIAY